LEGRNLIKEFKKKVLLAKLMKGKRNLHVSMVYFMTGLSFVWQKTNARQVKGMKRGGDC
jgi:hypothetical protein